MIFHPDKSCKYPEINQKDEKAISLAWKKKIAYLCKAANRGDKRALEFLVFIHLRKDLSLYSPEKARRYFLKARMHGSNKNWNQLYAASQNQ